ncbi:MAG: hypothetical protein NT038_03935 [Euryarchaeota archaeon]|nr:hypothetical protein [Euryarchaeota archaeon]
MLEIKKGVDQLYKDAVFCHFINKGYSTEQAKREANRLFPA